MTFARMGASLSATFHDIRPPFSNFAFLDELLSGNPRRSIRRIFSLARKEGTGRTLIVEDIEPAGALADENEDLARRFPAYKFRGAKRLTFWGRPCASSAEMGLLTDADLLGYALIKEDLVPERGAPQWHVFEAVFRKYDHIHNWVPNEPCFTVQCCGRAYRVRGVMYCQQNKLNKACAQVALRSLLCRIHPDQDVPYSQINDIAQGVDSEVLPGAEGLNINQICAVLDRFNVKHDEYLSEGKDPTPYSRFVYAGVENGVGSLVVFELSRPNRTGIQHTIPCYGHTFNQDTWVPRASSAYFSVGPNIRHLSSDEWVSSFIGHDDNFGPNYCIPRKFFDPSQVKCVVALRPPNTGYGAVSAEARAAGFLNDAAEGALPAGNYWTGILAERIRSDEHDAVLRTRYVTREQYAAHLAACRDWQGNAEDPGILARFSEHLPEHLWMVEVSIPELFPANCRKLGEVLLSANVHATLSTPLESLFVLARFPGGYFVTTSSRSKRPQIIRSRMQSHTPLYGTQDI